MLSSIQSSETMPVTNNTSSLADSEAGGIAAHSDQNMSNNPYCESTGDASASNQPLLTPLEKKRERADAALKHHAVSLAELEAEGKTTKPSQLEPTPTELGAKDAYNEQLAELQQALEVVTESLRDRDEQYEIAVNELAEGRARLHSFENDRATEREEQLLLQKAKQDQKELHARVQRLSNELVEKHTLVDKAEERFRQAVAEGEKRVMNVTARLNFETGKVTELERAVSEVDSLRKRNGELENELVSQKSVTATAKIAVPSAVRDIASSSETFSDSFVKRKMFELKIARTVISEKDKTVKEFRAEKEKVESVCLQAEEAKKTAESRANSLKIELAAVKKDLSDCLDTVSIQQVRTQEVNEEMEAMKSEKERARQDAAAASVAANESEEKRKGYRELLESTARRCNEALAEKRRSLEECGTLRESLSASEQEVARLQSILHRDGNINNDDPGSTSPCSLVTDVDSTMKSTSSHSRRLQSLADLEEAATTMSSKPRGPSCERKQQPRATSPDQDASVESLSRSLKASRMYCDEKNTELQESAATVTRQEEALKKLSRELASRKEECQILESRVHSELKPALKSAETQLSAKEKSLKEVQEEFDLHREMAEKTRSALELEVGATAEKLQHTVDSLRDVHSKLSASEQNGADLEDQNVGLQEQKREMLQKLTDFEQECEHRRCSLQRMQERLVAIESCTAGHEQNATDLFEAKERLETFLSQEVDRREVAEKRASRKDSLVLLLEKRALELERNHAALKEHVCEKTEHINVLVEELKIANEITRLRDEALQEQANICARKEALSESMQGELRMIIQNRDCELKETKGDLTSVERRVRSLCRSLEEERSKLKARDRELADATQKHSDSEAENRRKDVKLNEVEEQYARLKAELDAAHDELETRERQISSHLASITEKGGKIVGLRAEKSELEKTVRGLRNLLDTERNKFESQVAVTKKLEVDLSSSRTSLATCEDDLAMRSLETESLSRNLGNSQNELLKLENVVDDKDEEIASSAKVVSSLEKALERSRHQLAVLEAHLDGHDTLLKDNREKEEQLVMTTGDLNKTKELLCDVEKEAILLRHNLSAKNEDMGSLTRRLSSLEAEKTTINEELKRTWKARSAAEQSLNETSASLAALEKSTTEEIADLNATISSLKKAVDEKESSLNSASETITQNSIQNNLTKEQLIDSRSRGDRLFSKLTATEYELASKRETLTALETRFKEVQETLKGKIEDLRRTEKTLVIREQALSAAKSKLDEVTKKACSITEGELLTMQTKLEAKEKAIANLHNWCCFINGKLHTAEKCLSERDMDLEVSSTAFKKLEAQLRKQNELLSEKESQVRRIESAQVVENSELRSRIHSLQSYVEEARSQLERTKYIMSSDGKDAHSSLIAVSDELVECKTNLKSREKEVTEAVARKASLEEIVKTFERDIAASERTIECLTLDLGRLQSESSSKKDARDANDKNASEEILKVRSETGYLIVELRKAEAELSAAKENAVTWRQKAEELQPLAESTLEAQRAVEIVSSQLSLHHKDAKRRIDLLETQLKEAERERNAAERECSAAIADYTSMRARLMDAHSRGNAYGRLAEANTLCTTSFVLEGHDVPKADIMMYILGADSTLGQWNASRRLPVRVVGEGENGIIRKCEVVLSANVSTAYKYAADGPDGSLVWEGGDNRSLDLQGEANKELRDIWRSPN